ASVARTAAALATERGNALAAEAEQARVEQARLKLALEQEQVERLKFQGQFAWRTLSPEQRTTLVRLLSEQKGAVQIEFVSTDPEATFVAIQFEHVFRAAGWKIGFSANTYAGAVMLGVIVPDTPSNSTEVIRRALENVQIGFQTQQPPAQTMGFSSPSSSEAARLVIGSKPTLDILNAIGSVPNDEAQPRPMATAPGVAPPQ
ncbi:MAG TPA: hypothetical protein VHO91_14115, partial [Rhodopila sp.]|nr:hypothetical protein [Rhodopila sp.]